MVNLGRILGRNPGSSYPDAPAEGSCYPGFARGLAHGFGSDNVQVLIMLASQNRVPVPDGNISQMDFQIFPINCEPVRFLLYRTYEKS